MTAFDIYYLLMVYKVKTKRLHETNCSVLAQGSLAQVMKRITE